MALADRVAEGVAADLKAGQTATSPAP
jgi:hypothetical protein